MKQTAVFSSWGGRPLSGTAQGRAHRTAGAGHWGPREPVPGQPAGTRSAGSPTPAAATRDQAGNGTGGREGRPDGRPGGTSGAPATRGRQCPAALSPPGSHRAITCSPTPTWEVTARLGGRERKRLTIPSTNICRASIPGQMNTPEVPALAWSARSTGRNTQPTHEAGVRPGKALCSLSHQLPPEQRQGGKGTHGHLSNVQGQKPQPGAAQRDPEQKLGGDS